MFADALWGMNYREKSLKHPSEEEEEEEDRNKAVNNSPGLHTTAVYCHASARQTAQVCNRISTFWEKCHIKIYVFQMSASQHR